MKKQIIITKKEKEKIKKDYLYNYIANTVGQIIGSYTDTDMTYYIEEKKLEHLLSDDDIKELDEKRDKIFKSILDKTRSLYKKYKIDED